MLVPEAALKVDVAEVAATPAGAKARVRCWVMLLLPAEP